jgi:hypothetical protein
MLRLGLVFLVATALMGGCGSDEDDECPNGQTKRSVCVGCGPAGGCGEKAEMCARQCQGDADCSGLMGDGCLEGVCQVTKCF